MVGQCDEILFPTFAKAFRVVITIETGHLTARDAKSLVCLLVWDVFSKQFTDSHDQRLHPGPFRVDQCPVYVENCEFKHTYRPN